jgi:hypothetical protein
VTGGFQGSEKSVRHFPRLGKVTAEIFQALEKTGFRLSNLWKPALLGLLLAAPAQAAEVGTVKEIRV